VILYRTVVLHIPAEPVTGSEEEWAVVHTCQDCLVEVEPEYLVDHARHHETVTTDW